MCTRLFGPACLLARSGRRSLVMLVALLAAVATANAAPYCRVSGDTAVLGNGQLKREWARRDGAWGTKSFARADGSAAVPVSAAEEFSVSVYQGATITGTGCTWSAPTPQADAGEASLTFAAQDAATGLKVTLRYWLRGDAPFLRKRLSLTGPADTVISEVAVESLVTPLATTRGGYGQPLFLGDAWYTGLEYPAGYNDVTKSAAGQQLVLHHYPGRAVGEGLVSKTAVLGVAPPGLTRELAFSDYLNTIRIQTRSFVQYNSWYDLRGANLTTEKLLATFRQYKTNLLDPYGVKMDAFVPDDGWQNRDSIWMPDKRYWPQGFGPLAAGLEREGSALGIWMPLNGTNLNIAWGKDQGYEVASGGGYYCIVGPKYNAAIRSATERLIREGHLNYYKHDFNGLQCSAPGHGHLPDARHGHEASLDAEIGLLAWERQVNPRIFLNVTSNVWLSPWWLQYADSIWMCASDNGYEKTFPQLSPREWDMSYRDAHFYRVYRQEGNLVPLSALMTHGIIHGQLCRLGGKDETLREFSDMTVLYYARGVQLKELYITPDMMDQPRWQVLGEATRWAVDNAADLRNTVMIGGDLRQGQPYGYVHWNGSHGIIALRNPAPGTATVRVPFDQSVFYRGATGASFRARVIYPCYDARTIAWTSGRARDWLVPGCSVMVVDVRPATAADRRDATGAADRAPALLTTAPRAELTETAAGASALSLAFALPAGPMPRCDLYLILHAPGQVDFTSVTVNGSAVTPRRADGATWRLRACDLRPFLGQTVAVSALLTRPGEKPFSARRVRVEAWLIADQPTGSTQAPPGRGHTPYPLAQGYQRTSVGLLDQTVERPSTAEHLSDDDLAHLQAGRLRLEVFDVNGEPQYADKWITLNGQRIARVPANRSDLAAWQEVYVDLSAAQLAGLRRANTLTLGNAGGDCYKFRGVALALQRADGRWVTTPMDEGTYCSVDSWLYAEGLPFVGGRSPEITLPIP